METICLKLLQLNGGYIHLYANIFVDYEDAKRRLAVLLGSEDKNDSENQLIVAYRLNLDCISMAS